MKKRAWILCASALLLGCLLLLLCGCTNDQVSAVRFEEKPRSTYLLHDEQGLTFSLVLSLNGAGERTITYPGTEGIAVSGFSTGRVGTYTASVTYDRYTLEFTYSVYDGTARFAGGTGSAQEPFLIATAEQFQNMLRNINVKYYYKLISDIDFSGLTIEQAVYYESDSTDYFTADIDGNGYRLLNIDDIRTQNGDCVSKMTEVFGYVGDFKLKNITVHFASTGDYSATGLVTCATTGARVVFDNVTTTGFIDASHSGNTSIGVFLMESGRHGRAHSVEFRNCTNRTDILNSTMVMYTAGFTNTQVTVADISFEGCVNEATIEGANTLTAGFLTCLRMPEHLTFRATDRPCENAGTIIKTVAAESAAGQILATKTAEEQASVDLSSVRESGALDTSLDKLILTSDEGILTFRFDTGSVHADSLAYFKVVFIASQTYHSGMHGTLFYNVKVERGGSAPTDDFNAAVLRLRFIRDGEVIDDSTRIFGNPNIGIIGTDLVYDDTVLATGVSGPSKVYVFAYDDNHQPIGVSEGISLS